MHPWVVASVRRWTLTFSSYAATLGRGCNYPQEPPGKEVNTEAEVLAGPYVGGCTALGQWETRVITLWNLLRGGAALLTPGRGM